MNFPNSLLTRIGESKLLNISVSVLLAVPCTALAFYVFNKLTPLVYMYLNEISVRSELSEDYGFGMLMFLGALGCVAIAFPIFTFLIFSRMKRNSHLNISQNN